MRLEVRRFLFGNLALGRLEQVGEPRIVNPFHFVRMDGGEGEKQREKESSEPEEEEIPKRWCHEIPM